MASQRRPHRSARGIELAVTAALALSLNVTPSGVAAGSQRTVADPAGGAALAQSREITASAELPERLRSLVEQARRLEQAGSIDAAIQRWQDIVNLTTETLGEEHPETTGSLSNLADLHRAQEHYELAEQLYKRVLAIERKTLGQHHPETAKSLNNLALVYRNLSRFEEAESLYTQSLSILEKALGAEDSQVATVLNNLADLYQAQGHDQQAEALYQRALAIDEKALGSQHPDLSIGLTNLGLLYRQQERYGEAEVLLRRALAILQKNRGADALETATALANLASLLQIQGRYQDAEPLARQALDIAEKKLGPDHLDTASMLNEMARLVETQGNHKQAETLHLRALRIYEKSLPPGHPWLATSLNNLGLAILRQGRYAEARSWLERALSIAEASAQARPDLLTGTLLNLAFLDSRQGHYDAAETLLKRAQSISESNSDQGGTSLATILNNRAELYIEQARYQEAEPLLRLTIKRNEQILGEAHPLTAANLANLAGLLQRLGRYSEAEPLFRRSLAIRRSALGERHADTAASLNNLASLLLELGRTAEAEQLYRQSLSIREQVLGAGHPDTATALNNLAYFYLSEGRTEEAEPLLGRALAIVDQTKGRDHPTRATSLINLGIAWRRQRRHQQSGVLLDEAIAIYRRAYGDRHPAVANALTQRALLAWDQDQRQRAEELLQAALSLRTQQLGDSHPDTAITLDALATLQLEQKRFDASRQLLQRLTRSQADWLRRELPLQPRELRMTQLQEQPDAIATSFALLDQNPDTAPLALETRLNRQGLLAEIEQRQRQLMGSSPQTRTLGERISGLDRQLASIQLDGAQRNRLQRQRQRLEGELNRLLPSLRLEPVSTEQVASALRILAPQGVLVEFQHYRPYHRSAAAPEAWGAPRYVALLLHPDGRSSAIRLGEAAPIDQAIEQALAASAANTPEADGLWARVSALVLTPLEPRLRGVRELFLSPDGDLHRIPFAALPAPGNGGRLLNEAFQLRLLTTGRDLLRLQHPAAAGSAPALIANPDYNASRRSSAALPASATIRAATINGSQATARSSGESGGRSKPGVSSPTQAAGAVAASPPAAGRRQQRSAELSATTRWAPLPGTALEAQALAPLLGIRHPITDAAATAPLVMQQNAPRILHIATHGFFQRDQPGTPADPLAGTRSDGAPTPARLEDPLLRSGLVLAGANHPDDDPDDDGYLTAAEVTGINLQGTQLVTLSACQSGLGDLQSGEGVYGLQRSLAVAGARSTLLSLWNVDDDATRAFMQAFYSRLLRGEGRAEALAQTQNEFRNHPNPLYRDLYVWAAFQLTGDWRPISDRL